MISLFPSGPSLRVLRYSRHDGLLHLGREDDRTEATVPLAAVLAEDTHPLRDHLSRSGLAVPDDHVRRVQDALRRASYQVVPDSLSA